MLRIKHYRLYGPKVLAEETHLPMPALLRRAADAAAMRTTQGDLLLNGYLIRGLPSDSLEALRFALGRYTGAKGESFALESMPGEPEMVRALAQVLLHFGGLDLISAECNTKPAS